MLLNDATVMLRQAIEGEQHTPTYKKPSRVGEGPDWEGMCDDAENLVVAAGLAYDENGLFWIWDPKENYYHRLEDAEILSIIRNKWDARGILENRYLNSYKTALKEAAGRRYKTLTPQGKTIVFRSTGYDFDKKTRIRPGKESFLLTSIPWSPGKNTATPKIDAIFKTWAGEQGCERLKDLIAYACLPQNPLKLIIFNLGPANSGKSTYNKILETFLGRRNCHTTSYGLITDPQQRFEAINFRGKLAGFCSEVEGKKVYNTQQLKQLSGGDTLRGEYKGANGITQFMFGGKLFIAANDLPQLSNETDDAFKGRVVISDFPQKFNPGSVPIEETIPEEEYENLARWCLETLENWAREGITIRHLPTWQERVDEYTSRSNPLQVFCYQNIEFDTQNEAEYSDKYILASELLQRFNAYLSKRGQKEWDYRNIGRRLKDIYSDKEIYRTKVSNPEKERNQFDTTVQTQIWAYKGVSWKEKVHQSQESRYFLLDTLHVSSQVESNGFNGLDGLKEGVFTKTPYPVYHKCVICGLSPCDYQDKQARPICELCATSEEVS